MNIIIRIILIMGIIYIFYKLGQYDLMISFAESYNDNYYGGKKYTDWELRYDPSLNDWGSFNVILDLTLFTLWWCAIIANQFIK